MASSPTTAPSRGPFFCAFSACTMPLTTHQFTNHGELHPLAMRQELLDAAANGDVWFPRGTTDASLLPWIMDSGWINHIQYDSSDPEAAMLRERYGRHARWNGATAETILGFPLNSVLEVLQMLAEGQHPQFVAAAWETISDLLVPEEQPDGVPCIVFTADPQ